MPKDMQTMPFRDLDSVADVRELTAEETEGANGGFIVGLIVRTVMWSLARTLIKIEQKKEEAKPVELA